MKKEKIYTRNYLLKEFLHQHLNRLKPNLKLKLILVDEGQDLNPIQIKILKEISEGRITIAADYSQTIFQPVLNDHSVFKEMTHYSLSQNFRNTEQILRLAYDYQQRHPVIRQISQNNPFPFCYRSGIQPLYIEAPENRLYEQMKSQIKYYTEIIGYEKRNIGILTPSTKIIKRIQNSLNTETVNFTGHQPDFNSDGIRIQTIHISKGLEFPVVFLFLPFAPSNPPNEINLRNLIYVAMTRAVDHLIILTCPEKHARQIKNGDLILDLRQSYIKIYPGMIQTFTADDSD